MYSFLSRSGYGLYLVTTPPRGVPPLRLMQPCFRNPASGNVNLPVDIISYAEMCAEHGVLRSASAPASSVSALTPGTWPSGSNTIISILGVTHRLISVISIWALHACEGLGQLRGLAPIEGFGAN